ncbi:DUF397 domain-containing protein [Actinomadura sp. 9N215]|uniref:DUF397 domain-containing protein n=1 Tax=Actinomadura sp. 9N215 TaxID=3375150 RepID=UPI00378E1BD1
MTTWRKSARSYECSNCVELAVLPQGIAIRDSKAPEAGLLTLTPEAFAALLNQAKRSESGFTAPA